MSASATSTKMGSQVPAIGIDLGTTNSCVAVYDKESIEVLADGKGDRTTPSFAAFTRTNRLIGSAAKNQLISNPKNTIFDAKRFIGRRFDDQELKEFIPKLPYDVINSNGYPTFPVDYLGEKKTFTPVEISAMVLECMKGIAVKHFGGKEVRSAVITVPAYFNDAQRQATVDAAEIAGLNVLRIINEPTAAVLAYAFKNKMFTGSSQILVFDLGGGTFDVSIVKIVDGTVAVKATSGNPNLGGEDFNNKLVGALLRDVRKKLNVDLSTNPRALGRLRKAAEEAKRSLSDSDSTIIELEAIHGTSDYKRTITRTFFEELNASLFMQTLDVVDKCLQDASVTTKDIDEILLVGGSTRVPKIQDMLRKHFAGKLLNSSVNPDETVAHGAAVMAAIDNGDPSGDIKHFWLRDVTALSLGIELRDGRMDFLIHRNSQLPAYAKNRYGTPDDDLTTMRITIYEGERKIAKENHELGTFVVSGIPPAPKGDMKVDVEFGIGKNGILKVSATVIATGLQTNITITNNKGRLPRQEIIRMAKEGKLYRQDDEIFKDVVVAKNKLESLCYTKLNEMDDKAILEKLDDEVKTAIRDKLNDTLEWLTDNARPTELEISEKRKEVQDVWNRVLNKTPREEVVQGAKRMRLAETSVEVVTLDADLVDGDANMEEAAALEVESKEGSA